MNKCNQPQAYPDEFRCKCHNYSCALDDIKKMNRKFV